MENLEEAIAAIYKKHSKKLNNLKANREKWEENKWTDAECNECDQQIRLLAHILSDLNLAMTDNYSSNIPPQ
jgi:long-subunit acyl-CoA synthetase (AMP-forming)